MTDWRFDHDYEPGAFGVCRRCGREQRLHGRAGETQSRVNLTEDQKQALLDYVTIHGRFTWKAKLQEDWMKARAPGPLQQLRNIGGPSWLQTVKVDTVARTVEAAPFPKR